MTVQQQVSFLIEYLNDMQRLLAFKLPIAEVNTYCGRASVTLQFSDHEDNRPMLHPWLTDSLNALTKMGFSPVVSACINPNGKVVLRVTFYISDTSK